MFVKLRAGAAAGARMQERWRLNAASSYEDPVVRVRKRLVTAAWKYRKLAKSYGENHCVENRLLLRGHAISLRPATLRRECAHRFLGVHSAFAITVWTKAFCLNLLIRTVTLFDYKAFSISRVVPTFGTPYYNQLVSFDQLNHGLR